MALEYEDISSSNITDPSAKLAAITPADTDLAQRTRGIYVGGSGNLAVMDAYGTVVVFVDVLGGSILPLRVNQIRSTDTTATNIVALY